MGLNTLPAPVRCLWWCLLLLLRIYTNWDAHTDVRLQNACMYETLPWVGQMVPKLLVILILHDSSHSCYSFYFVLYFWLFIVKLSCWWWGWLPLLMMWGCGCVKLLFLQCWCFRSLLHCWFSGLLLSCFYHSGQSHGLLHNTN